MRLFGGKKKSSPQKEAAEGSGEKKRLLDRLSRKKKIIIASCMVVVAIALTVTALATRYVRPPEPVSDPEPVANDAQTEPVENDVVELATDEIEIEDKTHKKDFFTVLIAGTDNEGWNTDTIMLAAFDIATRKLNVLSIPRDTLVNVKRSNKKINAAYSVGGKSGNVEELMQEIKSVTGIRPDKYVVVTLKGFIEMIDAIGGVTIDVPIDMIYSDPAQDLTINIKKGLQTLNGYDSMGFMRYRHTYVEGDIGRIKVQQTFVKALVDKMLQPATLSKLPQLADIIGRNVKTDLTTGNIIWLGKEALNMNPDEDIETFLLPGEGGYYKRVSYYFLYENATLELINEHFNPYVTPIKNVNIIDPRTDSASSESSSTGSSNAKSSGSTPKKSTKNSGSTTKKTEELKAQEPAKTETPAKQETPETPNSSPSTENQPQDETPPASDAGEQKDSGQQDQTSGSSAPEDQAPTAQGSGNTPAEAGGGGIVPNDFYLN